MFYLFMAVLCRKIDCSDIHVCSYCMYGLYNTGEYDLLVKDLEDGIYC